MILGAATALSLALLSTGATPLAARAAGTPPVVTAATTTPGSLFRPTPTSQIFSSATTPVTAGSPRSVTLLGGYGVPSAGVTSVELVVHVHDATVGGTLSLTPVSGTAVQVPVVAGRDATTTVFVPTTTGASASLAISGGSAGVDIDVIGYDVNPVSGPGSTYHALAAPSVLTGAALTSITAGTPLPLQLTGGVIPSGATAVDAIVAVGDATDPATLSYDPTGGSSVTLVDLTPAGAVTAGATLTVAPVGTGTLNVSSGSTTVSVTALGYWTDAATTGGLPVVSTGPVTLAHLTGLSGETTVAAAGLSGIPSTTSADRLQVTVTASSPGTLTLRGGTNGALLVPYPSGTSSLCLTMPLPTSKSLTVSATAGGPTVDLIALGYVAPSKTSLAVGVVDLPGTVAPSVTLTDPAGAVRTVTSGVVLSAVRTGTWHVVAKPVTASGVTYYPAAATDVSVTAAALSAVVVSYADAVPATTKVVNPAAVRAKTGRNPVTLRLNPADATAASIVLGDTVTVGVSTITPSGVLGKVTKIVKPTTTSPDLVVSLATTTLLNSLPQASIDAAGPLGAGDVVTAATRPGSALGAKSLAQRALNPAAVAPVVQNIAKAVKCDSGVSMNITGSITVQPTVDFHAKWSLKGLTPVVSTAVLAPGITETAQLSASIKAAAHCSLSDVPLLAKPLTFTPINIQVGPVPVVLVPQLQFYLNADAAISAQISTSVTQTFSANAGIGYDHGRYYPITGTSSTYAYKPPTFTDDATADIHASAEATVLLYGVAGPGVTLTAGVRAEASTTSSYRWRVTSYLTGDATLSVPLLKLSSSLSLFDVERVVTRVGVDLVPSLAPVGAPFSSSGPATFAATIRNTGTQTSTGTITINPWTRIYYNTNLRIASGSGTGWTCSDPINTCQYGGTLAPGAATPPLTLTTDVLGTANSQPNPTTVSAHIDVDSGPNGGLGNRSANTTTPVYDPAQVELYPTITPVAAPFSSSGPATFQATIRNTGTQTSTGTISIDTSAGLANGTPLHFAGSSGTGWTCSDPINTCQYGGALAPGAATPPLTLTTDTIQSVLCGDTPCTSGSTASAHLDVDSGPNGGLGARSTDIDAPVYAASGHDLVVTVAPLQDVVSPGQTITATAKVANVGSQPVTGTTHVTVDNGATATGTGWTCSTTGDCTTNTTVPAGGTLPPLAITARTSSVDGGYDPFGLYVNVSNPNDQDTSDNQAYTTLAVSQPRADLVITVASPRDVVSPGQTITATAKVANVGSQPVTGTTHVTVDNGATATGTGWTCSTTGDCTTNTTVPAGGTLPPLAITARTSSVDGGYDPFGLYVNVSNPNDQDTSDNQAYTTLAVSQPRADLVITVASPQDVVSPGQTITGTAKVTNVGSQPVTGTTHVTVDNGATATGTGWTCSTTGDCTTTATVPAGGTLPPLTITMPTSAVDGGYYTASLNVGVTNPNDQATSDNLASTDVLVSQPRADLVVTVASPQDVVSPGQTITGTAKVTNVGSQPITGTTHVSLYNGASATGTGWTCSTATGDCTSTATVPAGGTLPPLTITTTTDLNDTSSTTDLNVSVSNSADQDTSDNSVQISVAMSG